MKTINILLVLLLLTACKKDEDKITTIEGILMASCNTPATNTSGFILTEDGLLSGPGISLSFTTNENGYFKVSYSGKKDLSSFMVRVQGSSDVLKVPGLQGNNKDLGNVYINPPSVSYYLRLEVSNNTYTESDTLTYYDWGYPQNGASHWVRKIAGPFESGIVDTVPLVFNMNAFPIHFQSSEPPNLKIRYGVNIWNAKEVLIPTPHCVDDYQMVTLVID